MANPKRRHSQARTGKRRSTWKLTPANYGSCPQCKAPKLPHRACPECGYYDGRQYIAQKQEKE